MGGHPNPQWPARTELALPKREGGYLRGQSGYEHILYTSLDILIEDGYRALTMRGIAKRCGMALGNLCYYFPTREALVHTLLETIIASYEKDFEQIVMNEETAPDLRLEQLCHYILEDIATKKTTRIFPELWALSNHDPFVSERVEELYARARVSLEYVIGLINPRLAEQERRDLALFISGSMEGLTMFVGYDKPFNDRLLAIKRIGAANFRALVIAAAG